MTAISSVIFVLPIHHYLLRSSYLASPADAGWCAQFGSMNLPPLRRIPALAVMIPVLLASRAPKWRIARLPDFVGIFQRANSFVDRDKWIF